MTDVSPILSVCIANNRMAAAPKVYLADTGILHSLLGIAGEHDLLAHHPKKLSCHPAHASIRARNRATQHEQGGHQFGERPFALSSPRSGRIEGFTSFN